MPWTSLHAAFISATLRIGRKSHLPTKRVSISIPSSKKPTRDASHQEQSLQRKVGMPKVTDLPALRQTKILMTTQRTPL